MKRLIVGLVVVVIMFALSPSTAWTNPCCNGDYDCNGDVDFSDYISFLRDFMEGFMGIAPNEPCNACNPLVVPKTGQTTSYAIGDDGDLQKGVAWPNPRFTDNLDGTVTDNLTGLIWLKNANCFGEKSWDQALSDSNGLADGQCGLSDGSNTGDWRLPNHKELFSLVDADNWTPALPSGHPFTNVQSLTYWSSTTFAVSTYMAWCMYMDVGYVGYNGKSNDDYVWPVRGGQ
jgi:hypothetical protein